MLSVQTRADVEASDHFIRRDTVQPEQAGAERGQVDLVRRPPVVGTVLDRDIDAYKSRKASSPTVTPGCSAMRAAAKTTPGMNELRS